MDTLVGILIDLMEFKEDMEGRPKEYGRLNVIRVLSGEGITYVKYMV